MTRREILSLYKRLLRYKETLKFTDQKYYYFRIKSSFYQNKELTNPKDISYHIEKGEALLKFKTIV